MDSESVRGNKESGLQEDIKSKEELLVSREFKDLKGVQDFSQDFSPD